jgi:hypothetical protein
MENVGFEFDESAQDPIGVSLKKWIVSEFLVETDRRGRALQPEVRHTAVVVRERFLAPVNAKIWVAVAFRICHQTLTCHCSTVHFQV